MSRFELAASRDILMSVVMSILFAQILEAILVAISLALCDFKSLRCTASEAILVPELGGALQFQIIASRAIPICDLGI